MCIWLFCYHDSKSAWQDEKFSSFTEAIRPLAEEQVVAIQLVKCYIHLLVYYVDWYFLSVTKVYLWSTGSLQVGQASFAT